MGGGVGNYGLGDVEAPLQVIFIDKFKNIRPNKLGFLESILRIITCTLLFSQIKL